MYTENEFVDTSARLNRMAGRPSVTTDNDIVSLVPATMGDTR